MARVENSDFEDRKFCMKGVMIYSNPLIKMRKKPNLIPPMPCIDVVVRFVFIIWFTIVIATLEIIVANHRYFN